MKGLNNILNEVASLMVKLTCVLLLMLTGLMLVRLKWYWLRRFGGHGMSEADTKPLNSSSQSHWQVQIRLSREALNNIPQETDAVVQARPKALSEANPTPVVLEPLEPSNGSKQVLRAKTNGERTNQIRRAQ